MAHIAREFVPLSEVTQHHIDLTELLRFYLVNQIRIDLDGRFF